MKTDTYKTLCLEQAALSPLHYRHGCIIVRGGKVIGQGFNDHRAGFSGGALKNGRLPVRSANDAALAELKKKHKLKRHLKNLTENTTFTPFENMGGGTLANTPLSMHSEMMAIHSALSASSTMAASAVSCQKPYFKLSGDSKRKARLRRDAVKAHVETICKAALAQSAAEQRTGPSSVQEWRFGDSASQPGQTGPREELDVAAPPLESAKKHRTKNRKYRQQHGSQYKGEQQQHKEKRRQQARKLSTQASITAPCHRSTANDTSNANYSSDTSANSEDSKKLFTSEIAKPYKQQKRNSPTPTAKTQPVLIPKGSSSRSNHSIADRMKHPRLNGADLYVARLGWQTGNNSSKNDICCDADMAPAPEPAPSKLKPSTGSLHEELLFLTPPSTPPPKPAHVAERQPSVLASRPCYRCISYMNSVGIKRVFWTTETGEWECAKVRDLVDALDNLGQAESSTVAAALSNVFVTKHEVLMLRRTMGGDG
ncbi:hypothetical protein CC80DRAFT_439722 [Byssothecium circinans]|uniref:CMP/dCMP-type deaminase domain-containing protein n=1 Tax=Byssothecium circinans TaxID=147558 RepID=A0A6A5U6V9_9PLEO|nr:hypothetical protein CC80DRAFT_439722 [Byssothecium circinans]